MKPDESAAIAALNDWRDKGSVDRVAARQAFTDALCTARELSPYARLIGIRIMNQYINNMEKNKRFGVAWPSQVTLAADLGITERYVRSESKKLVELGWFVAYRKRHYFYIPNWLKIDSNRNHSSGVTSPDRNHSSA